MNDHEEDDDDDERVLDCRQRGSAAMKCCYCVIIFDVNDEIVGTAFLRVGKSNISILFTLIPLSPICMFIAAVK